MATALALTLHEFVAALAGEIVEAVSISLLRQVAGADDIARLIALPPDEFAAQQVTESEVTALLEEQLGVTTRNARVDVRRVKEKFGILLEAQEHIGRADGTFAALRPEGYALLFAEAKGRIAESKRDELAFLLQRGVPRIVIDSGEVHAKVHLAAVRKKPPDRQVRSAGDVRIEIDTSVNERDARGYTDVVLRFRTVG